MCEIYDIIIIGGGIVGLGVFNRLTLNGYRKVLLVEKSCQIVTGASCGNSGILHTGFDTVPHTLESKLVKRGYELYQSFVQDLPLPIRKIGAYIVAWQVNELEILKQIICNARQVKYSHASFLHSDIYSISIVDKRLMIEVEHQSLIR
jgi:glycerol-3-phosphate dehydrogenase